MRVALRSGSLLLAGMLSVGCGDSTGPDTGLGTFTATFGGSLSGRMSGVAEVDYEAGGFAITMIEGSGSSERIFTLTMYERPSPGTYLAEEGMFGAALYVAASDTWYDYNSGRLTITSSSSSGVRGAFNVVLQANGPVATMKGSFAAKDPVVPIPRQNGTFTATYTGALSGADSGSAYFRMAAGGGFTLTFGNTTGTRTLEFYGEQGRLNSRGHQVGTDVTNADLEASLVTTQSGAFFSTIDGGLVTVISSSPTSIVGTFNVNMENAAGAPLTVRGYFRAACHSSASCY